jgi:hypothetical protein
MGNRHRHHSGSFSLVIAHPFEKDRSDRINEQMNIFGMQRSARSSCTLGLIPKESGDIPE